MSEATAVQLNNFDRLPLGLLQRPRLPFGALFVLSDVFSFTGEKLSCLRTYKSFEKRLGISRATVGRALRKSKDKGLIEHNNEKGYVFTNEDFNRDLFLRIEQWVHIEYFNIRGICRRLKLSERVIYGRIFTSADNKNKRIKTCEYSYSELEQATGISEKTVKRAVWALIRAGLIFRPKEDKGVNAYKKSTYTLNYKLIRELQKKYKKEDKSDKNQITEASAGEYKTREQLGRERRAKIEDMYSQMRANAERKADENLARARLDKRFKDAERDIDDLSIKIAFAGVREPQTAPELETMLAQAKRRRLSVMRILGLTEEDLKPQYACKLCGDTGFRIADGKVCKCFPPGKV